MVIFRSTDRSYLRDDTGRLGGDLLGPRTFRQERSMIKLVAKIPSDHLSGLRTTTSHRPLGAVFRLNVRPSRLRR